MTRLAAGEPLRIGSSLGASAGQRRQTFCPAALPATGKPPVLAVRGTARRRGRASGTPAGRRQLGAKRSTAWCSRSPGSIRLWNDTAAHPRVAELLREVRWTVLPLARCPAAAGQGMLAIECRTEDEEMLELLRALHDPDTAELAALELTALAQWPTAQRALLGATAIMHASLGPVCYVHGVADDKTIERIVWNQPPAPHARCDRFQRHRLAAPVQARAGGRYACRNWPHCRHSSAVFVAYWHALQNQQLNG